MAQVGLHWTLCRASVTTHLPRTLLECGFPPPVGPQGPRQREAQCPINSSVLPATCWQSGLGINQKCQIPRSAHTNRRMVTWSEF